MLRPRRHDPRLCSFDFPAKNRAGRPSQILLKQNSARAEFCRAEICRLLAALDLRLGSSCHLREPHLPPPPQRPQLQPCGPRATHQAAHSSCPPAQQISAEQKSAGPASLAAIGLRRDSDRHPRAPRPPPPPANPGRPPLPRLLHSPAAPLLGAPKLRAEFCTSSIPSLSLPALAPVSALTDVRERLVSLLYALDVYPSLLQICRRS